VTRALLVLTGHDHRSMTVLWVLVACVLQDRRCTASCEAPTQESAPPTPSPPTHFPSSSHRKVRCRSVQGDCWPQSVKFLVTVLKSNRLQVVICWFFFNQSEVYSIDSLETMGKFSWRLELQPVISKTQTGSSVTTPNCPVSVGYHLEFRVAMTFYYRVYDFLLKLHR
jgi:hypothetical protein